ncbi:MAG: hypothetical protein EOP48_11520 [Sphingobacteriales bacterium]|nr:MAG: hypothetical protein EOP48_11520 [Sphingobacteriales bacterium]
MKSLLLFAFITFSCSCMAQRVALSKSVSISVQKKLRKADAKELSSLVKNRLGKTKSLARAITSNQNNVFLGDDLIVLIKSIPIPKNPKILTELKLALDNSAEGLKNYTSKIENIDGREVYIVDQVTEGTKVYRFKTVNHSSDILVNGFIQYNPGDELKARKVLEDIIKGLKFDSE